MFLEKDNFKDLYFGDVEWKSFSKTNISGQERLVDLCCYVGSCDKDVLSKLEVGVVRDGKFKNAIVGVRNLPDGFVPRTITKEDLPFCEMCLEIDSKKEFVCDNCDAKVCVHCRYDGECCDKYSKI